MALRDQPYIPLYIQDFLTDEKLIECSAKSTGVYVRLMCIMHKSEVYGKILLKQKDKQKTKQIENFAIKLGKQMPYTVQEVQEGLEELLAEQVLHIDGDFLIQKRMVNDNILSLKRAEAGSKGGKFAKAKGKAKPQANTENEDVIENDIDIVLKLKESLDEIYIDQERGNWRQIDFDFELDSFRRKVTGSPDKYAGHDTGALRLAFQSQLRHAKKLPVNGAKKQTLSAEQILAKLPK